MLKKMLAGVLLSAVVFSACTRSNDVTGNDTQDNPPVTNGLLKRSCASQEVLEEQMRNDPALRKSRADIEAQSRNFIESGSSRLVNGVYEIPVVVNVVYNKDEENISLWQITSQIDVLNKDYGATNTDYVFIPSIFSSVKSGSTNIKFVLDKIVRVKTNRTSFLANDDVKKGPKGGIGPTAPTRKLNMWVCSLGDGLLGYAQFPGGSSSTDGVVINYRAFGNTGTASYPYDKGRTATHEVGHWLNLRHIWGDANCGSDFIDDTPLHNAANYNCPAAGHRSTCTGTPIEMTMNYMDYTDDACMYMFTTGQKGRMLATFATGGGRSGFAK